MLNLNTYLIKEHVGLMKLTDTYDIFDADSGDQVGVAKEEVSTLVTILRFFMAKRTLPTSVVIYDRNDEVVFSIHRPMSWFRARVNISDADGKVIGYFKSKIFSLGGGFYVFDNNDRQFAEVKGDWKGWNFKFLTTDGDELGTVTKKWAGIAKELFTSADNYVIALDDSVANMEDGNMLLLAAGLAIDIIYKEH